MPGARALAFLLALIPPQIALRCSPTRYSEPGDFTATHGRFLAGHQISASAAVSSAIRCSVLCYAEPRCSAFSYWRSTENCVLHGLTTGVFLETDPSVSYYQYKNRSSSVVASGTMAMSTSFPNYSEPSPNVTVCSQYDLDEGDREFVEGILPVDDFTLDFSVKAAAGAVLELCHQDAEENDDPVPVILLIIGASGNNRSEIHDLGDNSTLVSANTPGILSSLEFRLFWVSYQAGLVRFGRAAERQTAVLECGERGAAGGGVRRAAVSVQNSATSAWRVLGDCPEQD